MSLVLLGQSNSAASTLAAPSSSPAVSRIVASAAAALLLASVAGTAYAAPGDTSNDTTTANVEVTGAITLSALTPTFTLVGLPGATVIGAAAVSMLVETNNIAGYAVTVQSTTDTLDPADPVGNTDSIPIGALSVKESTATSYTPVSDTAAVTVHSQATRSAVGGDAIVNDYKVVIPFVNADTYSTTLNYVATTL